MWSVSTVPGRYSICTEFLAASNFSGEKVKLKVETSYFGGGTSSYNPLSLILDWMRVAVSMSLFEIASLVSKYSENTFLASSFRVSTGSTS